MKYGYKAYLYELKVRICKAWKILQSGKNVENDNSSSKVKLVRLSPTESFFLANIYKYALPFLFFCYLLLYKFSCLKYFNNTCINGIAVACTACILKTSENNLSSLSNIFVLVQVGTSSLKDAPCSFRLYSVFLNRCWSEGKCSWK